MKLKVIIVHYKAELRYLMKLDNFASISDIENLFNKETVEVEENIPAELDNNQDLYSFADQTLIPDIPVVLILI